LTSTGSPSRSATAASASSVTPVRSWPGTTGTPAAVIISRAASFEPIASIAAGGGPTHVRPASMTPCANDAFSERNP
jgi:hypothetical protein